MKSVLLVLMSFLLLGGLSSCKKDWTCACTNVAGTDSVNYTIKEVRKNDARTLCEDFGDFVGQCVIQ